MQMNFLPNHAIAMIKVKQKILIIALFGSTTGAALGTKYCPSFTHSIRHCPIRPLDLVVRAPRIFPNPWHEAGQAAVQLRGLAQAQDLHE